MQVGLPTKLPTPPGTIAAVAGKVPASSVPPSAWTVIVSTWFVFTPFVSLAGVISIQASTQTFDAFGTVWPAAVLLSAVAVDRVTVWPATWMSDVADTTVVPVVAEVMVTVQLAVAAPPAGTV